MSHDSQAPSLLPQRHDAPDERDPETPATTRRLATRASSLGRYSGLMVWAVLILIFGLWIPDLFLTTQTLKVVASNEAITAVLAIGLLLPTAAGVFDLSIAGTMAVSITVVVWAQTQGLSVGASIALTLLVGALIGGTNAFVVVVLKVDSFIATLGMTSILAAAAYKITNGVPIVEGIQQSFLQISRAEPFGIPSPVLYLAVVAFVVWYVIEYTPAGRYLFAVGGNVDASRLSGVPVNRMIAGSLIASGVIGAFAGVLLASRIGSASPSLGADYLLPAFSAVFLGATQIKAGRVNVLGTLIAVYLIATGVKGLQLVGAEPYVNSLFNGVALIAAVALAGRSSRR